MADPFEKFMNIEDNNGKEQSQYGSVVFGGNKPILEVELNEMQYLIRNDMRNMVSKIYGNCIVMNNIYNSTISIYTQDTRNILYVHNISAIIDGYMLPLDDINEEEVSYGDTFYLELKDDTIKIDNDERMNIETSRRKKYKINILKNVQDASNMYPFLEIIEKDDSPYVKIYDTMRVINLNDKAEKIFKSMNFDDVPFTRGYGLVTDGYTNVIGKYNDHIDGDILEIGKGNSIIKRNILRFTNSGDLIISGKIKCSGVDRMTADRELDENYNAMDIHNNQFVAKSFPAGTTGQPTNNKFHVLAMMNDDKISQIALGVDDGSIRFRKYSVASWTNWTRLLTTNDISLKEYNDIAMWYNNAILAQKASISDFPIRSEIDAGEGVYVSTSIPTNSVGDSPDIILCTAVIVGGPQKYTNIISSAFQYGEVGTAHIETFRLMGYNLDVQLKFLYSGGGSIIASISNDFGAALTYLIGSKLLLKVESYYD